MRVYASNFGLVRVWLAVLLWFLALAFGVGFADLEIHPANPDRECSRTNIMFLTPLDVLRALRGFAPSDAILSGIFGGAVLWLPFIILCALACIAFAAHPYQRRRALGIVTIPLGCLILAAAGYVTVLQISRADGHCPGFTTYRAAYEVASGRPTNLSDDGHDPDRSQI